MARAVDFQTAMRFEEKRQAAAEKGGYGFPLIKFEADKPMFVKIPFNSTKELMRYFVHNVPNGKMGQGPNGQFPLTDTIACHRLYDDPIEDCPFCSAGQKWSRQELLYPILCFDLEEGAWKIWKQLSYQIALLEQTVETPWQSLNPDNMAIQLLKSKTDGKVTRSAVPLTTPGVNFKLKEYEEAIKNIPTPDDVLKNNFVLRDRTKEEMQTFIATGVWPEEQRNQVTKQTNTQSMPTPPMQQKKDESFVKIDDLIDDDDLPF